jgi:hypothetical protein
LSNNSKKYYSVIMLIVWIAAISFSVAINPETVIPLSKTLQIVSADPICCCAAVGMECNCEDCCGTDDNRDDCYCAVVSVSSPACVSQLSDLTNTDQLVSNVEFSSQQVELSPESEIDHPPQNSYTA